MPCLQDVVAVLLGLGALVTGAQADSPEQTIYNVKKNSLSPACDDKPPNPAPLAARGDGAPSPRCPTPRLTTARCSLPGVRTSYRQGQRPLRTRWP